MPQVPAVATCSICVPTWENPVPARVSVSRHGCTATYAALAAGELAPARGTATPVENASKTAPARAPLAAARTNEVQVTPADRSQRMFYYNLVTSGARQDANSR